MKPALVMDVMDVMDKSRSYSFRVFHHHSIQGSPPIYPSPEWEFTLFIKTVIKSAEISDDLPPFQACPVITPKHSKTRCGRALGLMELTGVEPVSKLGINASFIHRFSFSNPRSGNPTLSRR
jgi:hypothetical protein